MFWRFLLFGNTATDCDASFSVKTYLIIKCFNYLKIYRTNKVNMIRDLVSNFFSEYLNRLAGQSWHLTLRNNLLGLHFVFCYLWKEKKKWLCNQLFTACFESPLSNPIAVAWEKMFSLPMEQWWDFISEVLDKKILFDFNSWGE